MDGEFWAAWKRQAKKDGAAWPRDPRGLQGEPGPLEVIAEKGVFAVAWVEGERGEETGAVPVRSDQRRLACIGAASLCAAVSPLPALLWDGPEHEGEAHLGRSEEHCVQLAPGQSGQKEHYEALYGLAGSPLGLSYLLEAAGPRALLEAYFCLENRILGPEWRQQRAAREKEHEDAVASFAAEIPESVKAFLEDLAGRPEVHWILRWFVRHLPAEKA